MANVCLSQPELPGMENNDLIQINLDERPAFSFSQPAHIDDLLLCTQLQAMQHTQPSQVCYFYQMCFMSLIFYLLLLLMLGWCIR